METRVSALSSFGFPPLAGFPSRPRLAGGEVTAAALRALLPPPGQLSRRALRRNPDGATVLVLAPRSKRGVWHPLVMRGDWLDASKLDQLWAQEVLVHEPAPGGRLADGPEVMLGAGAAPRSRSRTPAARAALPPPVDEGPPQASALKGVYLQTGGYRLGISGASR